MIEAALDLTDLDDDAGDAAGGDDLRAPFPWFGGKRRIADLVWSRFGDVDVT